ncbi:unnamed protein product [Cercospora beticola]|nr:unnamed protein product [Cercospora beticola]
MNPRAHDGQCHLTGWDKRGTQVRLLARQFLYHCSLPHAACEKKSMHESENESIEKASKLRPFARLATTRLSVSSDPERSTVPSGMQISVFLYHQSLDPDFFLTLSLQCKDSDP